MNSLLEYYEDENCRTQFEDGRLYYITGYIKSNSKIQYLVTEGCYYKSVDRDKVPNNLWPNPNNYQNFTTADIKRGFEGAYNCDCKIKWVSWTIITFL